MKCSCVQDCVVRIKGFGQKKITKLSQHGVSIPDVTCPLTVRSAALPCLLLRPTVADRLLTGFIDHLLTIFLELER